ncbi:hypothetical protein J6590_040314 [Homalodisca vitripennis]|nr:hypothetical protein J6590_040314 [Homalodisca vitripennis]
MPYSRPGQSRRPLTSLNVSPGQRVAASDGVEGVEDECNLMKLFCTLSMCFMRLSSTTLEITLLMPQAHRPLTFQH